MKQKVNSYEDLLVWQKAMALVTEVYRITEAFPKKEQYRLIQQTQEIGRMSNALYASLKAKISSKQTSTDYRILNTEY